jgi:GNAT superfamily N-acetyltransferase
LDGVILAGAADVGVLGEVIADAFFDLPPSRWLIPDPGARRAIFPGYFRLIIEGALGSGVVQTTPDRDAAALWIPADAAAPLPDYPERLAAVTGEWAGRFTAFDAALDRCHLAGVPHHYLAILAVRPGRQGHGIGTRLLNAYHQRLDQHPRTSACLEAADERTSRFYLKHGYQLRASAPFRLPDGGPLMWPMVRSSFKERP